MQKQTFLYKSPNSTRSLNDHVARLLAEGPYHGLEIVPSTPPSMNVDLTAGYGLTDEGVKLEETLPIASVVTHPAADPNYPRIDLVVLRHRYSVAVDTNGDALPNPATYHIVPGIPAPPPANPVAREEILPVGHPDYDIGVHAGDIILADVHVHAGCVAITEDHIFNRHRIFTTPELRAEIAEALYMAIGNFCYEGWDLSSNVLNVMVSPGRGLLCGEANRSRFEYIITTLRAREYLYGPVDPDLGTPYSVGENLTLNKQPDYSSKLRITIITHGVATSGNIYITGKNEFGEEINAQAIAVDCPLADTTYTFETISRFQEVYHEGIDAHELERTGPGNMPTIYIKDKPIGYIYAVGTQSGRALFKAVYDPAYHPLCNEYLLGWAETDETHVIDLFRWATTAQANVVEDLSPQCDNSRRSFTILGYPRGDGMLVLDGAVLMKNSPSNKGYTITGKVITLQSGVPTPDSSIAPHGETGADFWFSYVRQQ